MNKKIYTGMKDISRRKIYVGDILESNNEFFVLVCQNPKNKSFYGSLICELGDSCRNIPYDLNNGNGYLVVVSGLNSTL